MKLKTANLYFHNLLVPVYLVKKLYQLVPAYTEDGKTLFQHLPGTGIILAGDEKEDDYSKDGTSINLPTYEEVFEWFRNRGFYFDIRYNFEENDTCNSNGEINWSF